MVKQTSRTTRAIFGVLAILLMVGVFARRGAFTRPQAAPKPKVEAPITPPHVDSPPVAPKVDPTPTRVTPDPTKVASAPAKLEPTKPTVASDAPWEPAGAETVDGEVMLIEKRGNERVQRRKDGSTFETYSEVNGKREGMCTRWFANGGVYSIGEFKNGLKSGPWTFFQEDGSISQKGSFEGGARDGEWEGWYPNGTLRWRGSYKHDTQIGSWAFVTPTGQVDFTQSGNYENGKKVGN